MASFFRTKVENNIGTTPVELLATTELSKFTIIGCNLANIVDEDVTISITITGPDPDNNVGYYIRGLVIAPYTSAKVITNGEKLILQENCSMTIESDLDNSIDVVISYAEIL